MEQKCANCGNGKWRDGVTAITSTCTECRYVDKEGQPQPSNWKPKTKTNADHIRAMSEEYLAGYLIQYRDDWGDYYTPCCNFCDTYEEALAATIKWLKQPAEDQL